MQCLLQSSVNLTMTESEDLYSSYIVNCVFNAVLSCTAIMLNIVTMHALRKTSSLPKPLKTLLLSLSVSDLGVGLLVQPLYIALLMTTKQNNPALNIISHAFGTTCNLFYYASFFGVVALSAGRFLAIHLHLRYKELVTHKCVVTVVISMWVFSAILSLIRWWIPHEVRPVIFTFIQVFCLLSTAILYFKIYLAVRRHKNQMQALQVQQEVHEGGEAIPNVANLKKSAIGSFYVYLVFLACYLTQNCIHVADISTGLQSPMLWHMQLNTLTMVFLNSSLNPLIYCWKMRHIRRTVKNILRNMFQNHN